MPVLFIFHGFGGNALKFMNNDLKNLADQYKFMIISVQGALLDQSDPFYHILIIQKCTAKHQKMQQILII